MTDDKVTKTGMDTVRHPKMQDHAGFATSVKTSLSAAKDKTASIRKRDSQLLVANVVSPAAATLLATLAATIGGNAIFEQAAAQSVDGGWRLACILVAIFGFIATMSSVFKKQFEERLTQGNQCVGRLLSLDLAITTGSSSWEETVKEYGEIVKTFPEFVS
ncbi:MAG: hypothetical protein Q7J80_07635 [Anaerolineales bacterium]|nr:hypothetical protein [Anaerolineales bacterium]